MLIPNDSQDFDLIVEWCADQIERKSLLDIGGILAKKKRGREDAKLRCDARAELKTEMAAFLRAMKNRKDPVLWRKARKQFR